MSALRTRSAFYYGHTVDQNNCYLDFVESGITKTAVIDVGSYTLTKYLEMVARAINAALTADVTITVNRSTRIVTLTFTSAVDMKNLTGAHAGQSAASMLGLSAVDNNGVTSVVGSAASGSKWSPQFKLQSYVPSVNSVRAASASVSKSASGRVSVQKFGQEKFMKCEAKFITNILQQPNFEIETDLTGVESARAFMNYAITKAPIEFMADRSDPDTFERMILESTPQSSDGVGFELRERWDTGLPYYYDTGLLTFRVTEDL